MAAIARYPMPRLSVMEGQRFYRPELDCLRFFAFLSVFVYHTFPPDTGYYAARHIPFAALIASISRAGEFGVDLFFLLSAYLITELLLREKELTGNLNLKAFYVRRILRIWPLYFFAIGVAVALSWLDPAQKFPAKYIVSFLLLSGNWVISFAGFPGSVMNPLWSVSFEEQFYLLWPALVAKVRRTRTLLVACVVLVLTSQISRLVLLRYDFNHSEVKIFTNTLARMDPLAWGIASVLLLRKLDLRLSRPVRFACLASGIGIWLTAGHFFRLSQPFMIFGVPCIAIGAWLIFLSVYRAGWTPGWLRYLGKISYGLYVFHMLALYIADRSIGGHARSMVKYAAFGWIGFALTVALAAISYKVLESPFLKLKERFAFVKSRPV